MCIQQHTCVCPQQQLVGQSLTLGCNPQWTASATHMCVCAHSSNWSAKVAECSEPSLGLLIALFCNTHDKHSSSRPANPQLTSCETHVCMCSQQQPSRSAKVFSKLPKLQLTCSAPDMCVFRNTHVYSCVCPQQQLAGQPSLVCIQKHTCVCPQQQLVGHSLTLGCNRQLTSSATHVCVCSQQQLACQSVECSEPSLGFFIGLA